ncbi:MAG: RhuM family protein [Thermoleophilia bacterium]
MDSGKHDIENEIILYQSPDGEIQLDVHLDKETVWLTQAQMAELFDRERSVVTKHINNVFKEGELAKKSNVQNLHIASSDKPVSFYSLDAIISVGYRVKSLRGTQFRIWATRTLRDHLLRGYTLHEKRLREKGLGEIEQAMALLSRTLTRNELVSGEGRAALEIVEQYTRAWKLLLQYDEDRLSETPERPLKPAADLPLADANDAIIDLRAALFSRGEATDIFGQERADHLGAILGAVKQTFDGEPLYPTVQARAANLLYLVIKDHPFVDGNKRIGALLFLEYLRRNGLLFREDGSPRLANNAVVALALLVAESDSGQKDLMVRLILNLTADGDGK